jgi:hypothetical protein
LGGLCKDEIGYLIPYNIGGTGSYYNVIPLNKDAAKKYATIGENF